MKLRSRGKKAGMVNKKMISNEKVAGAGADMAADQDVPLQADHHQPGHNQDQDQPGSR